MTDLTLLKNSPPVIILQVMVAGKREKVTFRLRFGCTFSQKPEVGYDLAQDDEDVLKDLIY